MTLVTSFKMILKFQQMRKKNRDVINKEEMKKMSMRMMSLKSIILRPISINFV